MITSPISISFTGHNYFGNSQYGFTLHYLTYRWRLRGLEGVWKGGVTLAPASVFPMFPAVCLHHYNRMPLLVKFLRFIYRIYGALGRVEASSIRNKNGLLS